MPRRRNPPAEISSDEISLLLADAQTPDAEIASEPDAHRRRKLERARDLARDRLTQTYRSAEKRGQIVSLISVFGSFASY